MATKWIFFDVGSTLVDETEAYDRRAKEMIEDTERRSQYEKQVAQFADASANRRIWEDIQKLIDIQTMK